MYREAQYEPRGQTWTYIISTHEMVWGKDLGCSAFVTDFPADPVKAGWRDPEPGEDPRPIDYLPVFGMILAAICAGFWYILRPLGMNYRRPLTRTYTDAHRRSRKNS